MTLSWRQLAVKGAIAAALFVVANVVVLDTSNFFLRERHYHQDVAETFDHPRLSTLLLGDSHVEKIPNSLLGESTHNAAAGGDGYRETYAKLRYLLERSVHVDTLILTADYHMFGSGRVRSSNRSFVERYLLATFSAEGYEKSWLSSLFNLVPLFNDDFVQYLMRDLRLKLRRADGGSATPAKPWESLPLAERQRRARAIGAGDHSGIGIEPQTFLWYERLLRLAREHGIKIVSVRFPVSAEYRAAASEEGRRLVDAELARLGVRPVIDLVDLLPDATYFRDPDHVNENGAIVVLCKLQEQANLSLVTREVHARCGQPAGEQSDALTPRSIDDDAAQH